MAGGFLNIRRQASCMSKPTASPKAAKKKTGPPASDEGKWDFTKPLREAAARLANSNRLGRDVFARGAPEPSILPDARNGPVRRPRPGPFASPGVVGS